MHEKILAAAVRLAVSKGLAKVTRSMIARNARVAVGSVSYHFDGMDGLRKAVIAKAVETENLAVIAAAIAMKHPAVAEVPQKLKERALLTLAA